IGKFLFEVREIKAFEKSSYSIILSSIARRVSLFKIQNIRRQRRLFFLRTKKYVLPPEQNQQPTLNLTNQKIWKQ
ncbi:MAG: hypothetical protein AAB316_24495, partial [Bacteroidota bacterium]